VYAILYDYYINNNLQTSSIGLKVNQSATVYGTLNAQSTKDSSSVSTGSLVVAGGVGISKKLYVGGNDDILAGSPSVIPLDIPGADYTVPLEFGVIIGL
jgi:hypothetical protein